MEKLEVIKNYFGFTTKEAIRYTKEVDEKTINAIIKSFDNMAKKAFYED